MFASTFAVNLKRDACKPATTTFGQLSYTMRAMNMHRVLTK